jgi:RNA polymerase sigma-70 factor (ECF subfamily)
MRTDIRKQGRKLTDPTTDILKRCQSGDTKAFRHLVESYQSFAYALAYRLLYCREEAEDVVQESFIRVWRHVRKFNYRQKFTTWFYKIVTNLCYDKMKANTRRKKVIVPHSGEKITEPSSPDDLEEDVVKKDLVVRIEKIIDELSARQKSVFVLRDLQNLEIREVARILGISEGSVKTNLVYARRNIRKKLTENGCLDVL